RGPARALPAGPRPGSRARGHADRARGAHARPHRGGDALRPSRPRHPPRGAGGGGGDGHLRRRRARPHPVRVGAPLPARGARGAPPRRLPSCPSRPARGLPRGPTRPLLERLAQGRLDAALVHLGKGEGRLVLPSGYEDRPLEIERLFEEPLVLAVGPRHRLARRRAVQWKDLAEEELISFGPGSTIRDLVAWAARRARVAIRAPVSAVSLGTIRALVSAGLGVAVLPRVALDLPGPALRGVPLTAPALARIVALARNTARYESPAARVFTEFLRERLRT